MWKGGFGIGPGLAMSRSLGDHAVAEVGVTAEPVMLTEAVTPEDEVLILASDGVWEFISSQEACESAPRHHAPGSPRGRAAPMATTKFGEIVPPIGCTNMVPRPRWGRRPR